MPETLGVTLYGTPVGELGSRNSVATFTWTSDAEERWGLGSPVLSQSLLVGRSAPSAVDAFFGGLLPEGIWLDRLAQRAAVSSRDIVGLLGAVGADLAGALVIGDAHSPSAPERLDDAGLELVLESASNFLVGGGGTAVPGYQRKVTLTRRDDAWWIGNGTWPSTHILKPVAAEYRSAADAEAYILKLARALGLTTFAADVEDLVGRPVLVVERYDRIDAGSGVHRLHQEDAGQALGLPWGGGEKFESTDPRANLAAVAALLDRDRSIFSDAEPDRERLLRYVAFNVAVGNSDAHAKNFSLLHEPDGEVRLAPLYDAAPLALSYDGRTDLAMRIGGVRSLPDVTLADLVAEAGRWGIPALRAREVVEQTLLDVEDAARRIPAPDTIARHVPGYVRGQARNLLDGRAARIPSAGPLMALPYLGTAQPRD
jgi:serine/threonine-protein kinase HipA